MANYDYAVKSFMMGAGFSLLLSIQEGLSTYLFGAGVTLSDKVNDAINGGGQ